ncbi:hypothetical protein BDV39DRAFT_202197 [Aspergillus sergii]|uniref:Uncharacterized protein n=1 Tax=Aspergillus sergii TaxID=1034303 RepID=A0A5N6XDE8_9EURO|nr:hypothetical protein BDV39DRAFT_202197 [Aspergillus sergii]
MSGSMYPASPLQYGSSDSGEALLTDLSLTDPRETGIVEQEPSGFSQFLALLPQAPETGPVENNTDGFLPSAPNLATSTGECNPEKTIEELTQEMIPQQLAELQKPRRFKLNETDDLCIQGRQFQKKWDIPEEGFNNWKALLSGWLEFPAILLLNPSPWDHLPFDEMVDKSPTLSWLQKTLGGLQLQLDDVIILDTFPMLRDNLRNDTLTQMGPARLDELARESFALTRASLAIDPATACGATLLLSGEGAIKASAGVRFEWTSDASGTRGASTVCDAARADSGRGTGGTVRAGVPAIRDVAVKAGGDAAGALRRRSSTVGTSGAVAAADEALRTTVWTGRSGVEGPLAAEHVEELRKQLAEWEGGNKLNRKEG